MPRARRRNAGRRGAALLVRSLLITAVVGLLALRYLALEQRTEAGARTQQEAQM